SKEVGPVPRIVPSALNVAWKYGMSSVAAGRWSMVHVIALAPVAIANRATTAIHVRKVFFIEISSLLLRLKNTLEIPSPRAIPSPPLHFYFELEIVISNTGVLQPPWFEGIFSPSRVPVKKKKRKICSEVIKPL